MTPTEPFWLVLPLISKLLKMPAPCSGGGSDGDMSEKEKGIEKKKSDLCSICIKIGQQNRQTLEHVLSHCQAALKHGRYNTRHDHVLGIFLQHVQEKLPKAVAVVVDLADHPYKIPVDLPTDLRPDLVVHSFQLTVCWVANFQSSWLRNESKYLHLLDVAHSRGKQASLHPIQVKSL